MAEQTSGPRQPLQVQVPFEGTDEPVMISERAALTLLKLVDGVQLKGGDIKIQVGLAQYELQQAINVLNGQRQAIAASGAAAAVVEEAPASPATEAAPNEPTPEDAP